MRYYLENTFQLTRGGMRDLIIDNGFNSARALITKKAEFVSKMCTYIRKCTQGAAQDRNVTVDTEQRLSRLQLYTEYCYMPQREVDLNNGPTLVQYTVFQRS